MVCKNKTKTECLAGGNCIWVKTRNCHYCRKKPSRAGATRGQQGQGQGQVQTSDINRLTLNQLRAHPLYKQVVGRSKMNKAQLVQALKMLLRQQQTQTQRVQQTQSWSNKCKQLEKNCPMSSTLLGDEWCDVDEKDVIYTNNYNMCFEYRELLRVIHEGFVALDTSYQVPPLRLKLPRDPVRNFIPKVVLKKILMNKEIFEKNDDYFMDNEELWYFFIHLDDFYKTFDKPEFKSSNVNPVTLSKEIEKWFKKYKSPAGGLSLERYNQGNAVQWRFKKFPTSYTLLPGGKIKLYTT